jgi:LysR substrate binding domain.
LTVGAIMGAAPDLLAMAVAALKTESPLLNVRILGETSDQVVQLLHRREVDLALGRLTSPLQHNDFSFEPLARETCCWWCVRCIRWRSARALPCGS